MSSPCTLVMFTVNKIVMNYQFGPKPNHQFGFSSSWPPLPPPKHKPRREKLKSSSNKFENMINVVFLKKLYLKNIKIIFFYFLKINFDINKLK